MSSDRPSERPVQTPIAPRDRQPGAGGPPVRVLIVDDSKFVRTMIRRIVEGADGLEVAGEAENGKLGVEAAATLKPDVVTLDVEMPEMDGLTALPQIRRAGGPGQSPAVVMVSSLTKRGSETAFRALSRGAADVIAKDRSTGVNDVVTFGATLVRTIKAVAPRRSRPTPTPSAGTPAPSTPPTKVAAADTADEAVPASRAISLLRRAAPEVLVIGSSTGGPPVVEKLVRAIPANCSIPVVIAQHMPALFTKTLAERLDRLAQVPVSLGEHRAPLEAGRVYVAEGGLNTRIVRRSGVSIEVGPEPVNAPYKPSCDELFRSASSAFTARTLAVVLTGMGEDGLDGGKAIKAAGGVVMSQHGPTCVVYGMPRAVTEGGVSSAELTPDGLAEVVTHACRGGGAAGAARRSA